MGVFFSFSLGLTMELGQYQAAAIFGPGKEKRKRQELGPK
jgi:hypothetical protein